MFLTRASYRAQPKIFKKHVVSIECELIFFIGGFDLFEKIVRFRKHLLDLQVSFLCLTQLFRFVLNRWHNNFGELIIAHNLYWV